MRNRLLLLVVVGLWGLSSPGSSFAQQARSSSADDASIRKDAEAYGEAYNKGNFDAAGQYWAPDAEYINDDGKVAKGRDAIVALFKKGRVATKGYSFKVNVQSVRLIKPDVALEEGMVTLAAPDGNADKTRFTAVLLKSDGKWLLTRVQDIGAVNESEQGTPYSRLKQLEWLVGKWEDEEQSVNVQMTCQWGPGKTFLIQEYTVQRPNDETLHISQRLGWDPTNDQIHSWIFDSRGGFSEGVWSRNGNQWEVKVGGVLPDARRASARQVWSFVDDNHYKWQALDREIDSHPLADTVVKFRRSAPDQQAAAQPGSK